MSLDFSLLDAEGRPAEQVGLGVDAHHRLMTRVGSLEGALLLRTRDYYGDAEFDASELSSLQREVEQLRSVSQHEDPELHRFLTGLAELVKKAATQRASISVIAD